MAKAKPCSRLKLLIDMKKDRVLFAEAGKDFVENMCMILRSGCVHHLCKGVGLLSEFSILESEAAETYIITDDLVFTPMSTLVLLKIFQKFEISDMDSLSEITATVSDSQMNNLAIVSLRSKTVLTDVLLPSQARHTKRKEENSIQKQDDDNEVVGDKQKEDPIESAMRVKPSKSRLLFFQKRKEENSIQKQDDDNEEEGGKQKEDPIESAMRVKPSKRTKSVRRETPAPPLSRASLVRMQMIGGHARGVPPVTSAPPFFEASTSSAAPSRTPRFLVGIAYAQDRLLAMMTQVISTQTEILTRLASIEAQLAEKDDDDDGVAAVVDAGVAAAMGATGTTDDDEDCVESSSDDDNDMSG